MSRSKSSAAKKERRRITRKARRARAANSVNSVNSAKKSKSSHPYPLRSLLGKADNQPLSTLNCPLPKTGPKTASKAAPKETAKPQKKEKKSGKIRKLARSSDPLEKHVRSYHPMPRDYVFVPKGNVYITRHCRSKTKSIQKTVYIVWDRTGSKSLGIRVPSSIHSEVREMSSETAQHRALIVQANNTKILAHGRRLLLKEYPKVPPDSLETILNHAFLKGSGRVGRSNVLTDRRKALLAVQAYIRHNLTSYEYLLKRNKKRDEARREVEPLVRAIMKSWMGVSSEQDENLAPPGTSLDDPISISSSPCSSRAGSVMLVDSGESEGESEDCAESVQSTDSPEML